MSQVLPFLLSMIVTMALTPVLARYATRLGLLDAPALRKVHTAPVPRVGGIAMMVGVVAALSGMGYGATAGDRLFLVGAAIIFVIGVIDDRFDIDYRFKLLGQVAGAALLVVGGDVAVRSLDLPTTVVLPHVLASVITMFYLVGVTNAVNLSDGLDGLAGGTTLLCLLGLAWLSYVIGHPAALSLSLAFAGAVLGFLRFNSHPATVFMGDGGSQLLGFAIGGLSLLAVQDSGDTVVSASLPILLLGMPILDTLQVMVRRIAAGQSPFRADRGHLHHRLLSLGLKHHEAVMVIYAAQVILFLIAYAERFATDLLILLTFASFSVASLLALRFAETMAATRRGSRMAIPRARWLDTWRTGRGRLWITSGSITLVSAAICAYALLVLSRARAGGVDLRVGVLILVVALVALLVFRRNGELSSMDKGVFYASFAAIVLVDAAAPSAGVFTARAAGAAILVIAFGTVVALRANAERAFSVSPLDMLVLFLTLVVPNLPESSALGGETSLAIAKLVVLCYAAEVVMTVGRIRPAWARLAALAADTALLALMAGG